MGEVVKVYEKKTQIKAGDHDLQKTDKIPSCTITWITEGTLMDAGPRHVEEVRKSMRLETAKAEAKPRAA
eukprot:3485770-Heterocapsa_arctica.AAC.1